MGFCFIEGDEIMLVMAAKPQGVKVEIGYDDCLAGGEPIFLL